MGDLHLSILEVFSPLAKEYGLKLSMEKPATIEIGQHDILLRVRSRIERLDGVFVTLFAKAKPSKEYGLSYLVEFKGGQEDELACAISEDPKAVAGVVKKYALGYVLGLCDDFDEFESYARNRIEKNMPDVPEIKANKWIRPEWITDREL